jgi:hypothetical protein
MSINKIGGLNYFIWIILKNYLTVKSKIKLFYNIRITLSVLPDSFMFSFKMITAYFFKIICNRDAQRTENKACSQFKNYQ